MHGCRMLLTALSVARARSLSYASLVWCRFSFTQTVASPDGVLEAAIKEGFSRTEDELRSDACGCIFGPPRGAHPFSFPVHCCVHVPGCSSLSAVRGEPADAPLPCDGDSRRQHRVLCLRPVSARGVGRPGASAGRLRKCWRQPRHPVLAAGEAESRSQCLAILSRVCGRISRVHL